MYRLADRRVVHLQVVADGTDHYFSGIQTHSDLNRNTLGPPHSVSISIHRLLHSERRIAGAHRMIFMGERRTEQRHDAVAHEIADCSLIAVHRFHHVLDHWIEQFARFLRIAVGEQLHRAFHVSEQHRDLLALAFERAFGSENLFGEMLGSVGFG